MSTTCIELCDLNLFSANLVPRSKSKFIIIQVIYNQMDLFRRLMLLYILMASFSFCRQEEKKRKSQSAERQMKDERILNLQRKILEKAMERKKQEGLLKITPQKASTASRKVREYIRKRALQ